jgi:hypothetical protein
MKTGRPPAYDTPEDMQQAIDSYFDQCVAEDRPPTVTGLALALGFEGRQGLLYYETDKPEFLVTVKRAKGRIEQYIEEQLYRGSSVTGLIFNLKNNFGWKDSQEFTHLTEDEDGNRKQLGLVWPGHG